MSHSVSEAARILRHGGVVAIPTETVYGLAAMAHDRDAVMRVFSTKGRPTSHPLIVHLGPSTDPTAWGQLDDNALRLAAAFWPGPLTLLVPRTSKVPDWVTGGRDTVALRVPSHPMAQQLLDELDDGLVAPSANVFGHVSPTKAEHVEHDLGDAIDLILDGGPCSVGVESTIVECINGRVQILRPGAVTRDDIEKLIGSVDDTTPDLRAPGMLASHYAPDAAVILCSDPDEMRVRVAECAANGQTVYELVDTDVRSYALHLYERMREADSFGADVIVALLPPATGLGTAIRDRLSKAAAGR